MPVKKGDIVEKLKIVDIGDSGNGIGKLNEFTIFTDKGIIGDILKVEIIKKDKKFAKAKMIKVIQPSQKRVEPQCKYFEECGGCQIQDMDYEEQLKFKKDKVENALKRIGKLENIKVNDIIGMKNPYNYRNKVQFPIQKNGKEIKIGFYKKGTHNVVDVGKCLIQSDKGNEVLEKVRKIIKESNISIYDKQKHKGVLRHILIRNSEKGKEIMVVLVTNGNNLSHKKTFIRELSKIEEVKSIVQNINSKKGSAILGSKNIVIYGKNKINDFIGNMKYEISPLSFFQVNDIQTEKLYNKVLEYAELTGEEIVFDLYCGIGTISLFLAKKAKKVYGVEIIDEAIEDAKKNAEKNNIDNAEFIVGKAETEIPKLYDERIKADVVVVDPPRSGCDQSLLKTIVKMNPKKIVYVSCKPSTLARDLKYLVELGYEVKKVQPVDMFPHSTHVECCVKLEK